MRYRKLPGTGRSMFSGYHTVWEGEDHLLIIESSGYAENYKRLYYKDIEAFIVRDTPSWMIVNIFLGALTLLFLYFAVRYYDSGTVYFSGIMGLVVMIILIVSILKGKSCDFRVKTAVQTIRLPSVSRAWNANKFIRRIVPRIEEYQRETIPEEAVSEKPGISSPEGEKPKFPDISDTREHYSGSTHLTLFSLLEVYAIVLLTRYFHSNIPVFILHFIVTMLLTVFIIMALVIQHRTNIPGTVSTLTWLSIPASASYYILSVVMFTSKVLDHPGIIENNLLMVKTLSKMPMSNFPTLSKITLAAGLFSFIIGFLGSIITLRYRKESPPAGRANMPSADRSGSE